MTDTSTLLITGGTIIDPSVKTDGALDILIRDGVVAEIGKQLKADGASTLEASGCLVFPGLVDMHTHLREPGFEESETIMTGCDAAAAGGFTAVCAMPNCNPPTDDGGRVRYILERAKNAKARVYVAGAITRGRAGAELAEMVEMSKEGAVAFSDDGSGVANARIMFNALRYSAMLDMPIMAHEEDADLSKDGQMNDGKLSAELGLAGIPELAEELQTDRDLRLAEYAGGRIHITHISTARTVELIREAKARGVQVTCDVTPHHLTLSEELLTTYDTRFKMKPPLRTLADIEALRAALVDGVIDAIATDHAPHFAEIKECEFTDAAFGVTGLETALGVLHRELVDTGICTWRRLIEALSCAPARILGVVGGSLSKGSVADVTVYDPSQRWTVTPSEMRSKSGNTAYFDWELPGAVRATVVGGMVHMNE